MAAAGLCALPAAASALPPPEPDTFSTSPSSPANNNTPFFKGNAEAGSTVAVYKSANCSGPAFDVGSAATFAGTGFQLPAVADDSTTPLSASAINAGLEQGPCSISSPFSYTEDSTGPAAPTLLNTNPASPSSNSNPFVKGTASGDSASVSVFANGTCGGTAVTGSPTSPATFFSTGLQVSVTSDGSTQLSARGTDAAGNGGGCATINYTRDTTGPAAPTLLNTNPASPSNNNNPFFKGIAASDSVSVSVYKTADCTGTAATGSPISPATFASPGLQVSVPSNVPTPLSARATDALGNVGDCSFIIYAEDSTGPAAPTGLTTSPPSPANTTSPLLQGTAATDTATGNSVSVFANGTCSGTPSSTGSRAAFASPGLQVIVPPDTLTSLSANSTDALGNVGDCSLINYTEDSTLPTAPTLETSPASPANNNDPILRGTTDPITTVAVFTNGTCSGHSFNGGSPTQFASGFSFHVADNTTTRLSAKATDLATNKSACSSPLNYEEVTPGAGTLGKKASKCKKKSKSKHATAAKKHKKHKHCKHKKHKKKK